MTDFVLFDERTAATLSSNPNAAGAKLSALFFVENGDSIYWEVAASRPDIAIYYGNVDGDRRFRIAAYKGG
jgi:hypothetical protein